MKASNFLPNYDSSITTLIPFFKSISFKTQLYNITDRLNATGFVLLRSNKLPGLIVKIIDRYIITFLGWAAWVFFAREL